MDDLYDLASMAFAVEIALAVARKDTCTIQIKNKQDLYQALINRERFDTMLEQGTLLLYKHNKRLRPIDQNVYNCQLK